jgi:molybdate transport system permease protein
MIGAQALGEFGATIVFAGNFLGCTQTRPPAIYLGFETDVSIAITLVILLVAFWFGVLLMVNPSQTRGLKAERS